MLVGVLHGVRFSRFSPALLFHEFVPTLFIICRISRDKLFKEIFFGVIFRQQRNNILDFFVHFRNYTHLIFLFCYPKSSNAINMSRLV